MQNQFSGINLRASLLIWLLSTHTKWKIVTLFFRPKILFRINLDANLTFQNKNLALLSPELYFWLGMYVHLLYHVTTRWLSLWHNGWLGFTNNFVQKEYYNKYYWAILDNIQNSTDMICNQEMKISLVFFGIASPPT